MTTEMSSSPPNGDKCFVTGCAGFIGSHLVDALIARGHEVVGFDNLSTGQKRFLADAEDSDRFTFVEGDVLDLPGLTRAMQGADTVFHLAANADIRSGLEEPRRDFEQNTLATFHVLEAMRAHAIETIAFASSGAVYGEPTQFPTPEDAKFPEQTSLYGASKLAGEGMIAAYCEGYGMRGFIFRFVSILGERYSHGHVFDFYQKLRADPEHIEVLGNGKQRKSYLYVGDCVGAMLHAVNRANGSLNIFNLGNVDYCTVDQSLGWITEHLNLKPKRSYQGGERGWVGDAPFVFLDTSRIQSLGWRPEVNIQEGVLRTVGYLQENEWLLQAR